MYFFCSAFGKCYSSVNFKIKEVCSLEVTANVLKMCLGHGCECAFPRRWWLRLCCRLWWWFFHRYVLISKLIKLFTLNNFFYFDHSSKKWFFKKKDKQRWSVGSSLRGFFNHSTVDIWAKQLLVWEGRGERKVAALCTVEGSAASLSSALLDACSTLSQLWQHKMSLDVDKCSLRSKHTPTGNHQWRGFLAWEAEQVSSLASSN